jgi:hypothetical protein
VLVVPDTVLFIMRLTVGPLPPAVYWRRRALVLGALLLVVIVLSYSCGGSGESGASPHTDNATSAATSPSTATTPPPANGEPTSAAPTGATPVASATAAAAATGPCTDAEMSVTPIPAKTTAVAGSSISIRLKIKNVSNRTCRRDVGADLQELRIVKGGTAEKVWSSDDCASARGNDVQSFPPGFVREYLVTWNGKASTSCTAGMPNGEVAPGEYQLFGRLGTKLSNPVRLTLN